MWPEAQSVGPAQLDLQPVVAQAYAPQSSGVGVVQLPDPLQTLAGVSTPLVQVAAVHATVSSA
jgi:hypothetical protein